MNYIFGLKSILNMCYPDKYKTTYVLRKFASPKKIQKNTSKC